MKQVEMKWTSDTEHIVNRTNKAFYRSPLWLRNRQQQIDRQFLCLLSYLIKSVLLVMKFAHSTVAADWNEHSFNLDCSLMAELFFFFLTIGLFT